MPTYDKKKEREIKEIRWEFSSFVFFAYLIKLLYIIQIPLFHLLENCFRFALYTLLFTVWKHYSIC